MINHLHKLYSKQMCLYLDYYNYNIKSASLYFIHAATFGTTEATLKVNIFFLGGGGETGSLYMQS